MIKVFPSGTLGDLVLELLGIQNVVVRSLTVQLDHSNSDVLLNCDDNCMHSCLKPL